MAADVIGNAPPDGVGPWPFTTGSKNGCVFREAVVSAIGVIRRPCNLARAPASYPLGRFGGRGKRRT